VTRRAKMRLDVRLSDDLTRTVYSTDNSIYQVVPDEVVLPDDGDEIVAVVRDNTASAAPRPIVARGGGTGTNGQALGSGIVIDVKRRMNQLIDVDHERRTAVVQPGLVTARLNQQLQPHGLHWAPHTSTLNRATVGGMISTDAAGKGSLVHGRAHRHVLAVDMILDDGTRFRAQPTRLEEAEVLAAGTDRIAALWRDLLAIEVPTAAELGLPELARGFSGYGIDRLHRDGVIDPLALVVGAEGTLGVIESATIALTPLPAHTLLVIASYPSFAAALEDSLDLRTTLPTAIETFDERTLDAGRSSPAWPALGSVVGDRGGSVLLLEYTGDAPPDAAPVLAALEATGRSVDAAVVTDAAVRSDAWKVRADAVGLLAKIEVGAPDKSRRPTAFVEDCAVPVDNMCAFITDFRAVLDAVGVEYGMFGHADVGCVHVRPALDTIDLDDERLVREISDTVVAVVRRHGGVLWGEHGRGFRGESVADFVPASTIELMRQVKTAFDPGDVFNPGKLYRPAGVDTPILPLDGPPLRGEANRGVPVEVRRHYADAFACNGNALCHHHDAAEVMCPSFKATGDQALSPRGRADLLREWLRRREPAPDSDFGAGLEANLAQCLSCSACTGRCPVEVDIPEMKSRFLADYYRDVRRPLSHRVLSRFESVAALATRVPWLARLGARPAGALLGLRDLPLPRRRVDLGAQLFDPAEAAGVEVVVIQDSFTSHLEPETAAAAVRLLQRLGYEVRVASFVPSGKYDHVKGLRTKFESAANRQRDLVAAIDAVGAVPVVIEPATGLLHSHEYPRVVERYPDHAVRHLDELILERADQLGGAAQRVVLLGHCTERATRPAALANWTAILESAGHTVTAPAVGCCGMAGIFGHERGNQELSREIWDLAWADAIETDATVAATGFSCRSQADRLTGRQVTHPVHLL